LDVFFGLGQEIKPIEQIAYWHFKMLYTEAIRNFNVKNKACANPWGPKVNLSAFLVAAIN
jgi:hypothetical protein